MRSVTEIKKNTTIKELHPALVPKWSSTTTRLDSDNDSNCDENENREIVETERSTNSNSTSDTTLWKSKAQGMESDLNGALGDVLANNNKSDIPYNRICDDLYSSDIKSSHLKGESDETSFSGDKIKMEMAEHDDTHFAETKTNSGDKEVATVTSSHKLNAAIAHTPASVQETVKPQVPKMKYFFERGDSLKKEEEEVKKETGGGGKEKFPDLDNTSRGTKRPHKAKVR